MPVLSYKVYICFKLDFMIKHSLTGVLLIFLVLNFSQLRAQNKLNSFELMTVSDLLSKKHSLESNSELKSTYKLQIFSGSLEKAEETQVEFESLELDIESKILYQTPNYKVWIGNYRNRIQADRAFEKVKNEYPNTLIIKPGK